jgi:hypothetical protein
MSELDVVRERTRSRPPAPKTRGKKLKIERKKPRPKRFRGVPDFPTFDIEKLPPSAWLTSREVAAALRRSLACMENWRLQKDPPHPLPWSMIGGRPRYQVRDVRAFMQGGSPSPRASSPATAMHANFHQPDITKTTSRRRLRGSGEIS